MFRTIQCGSSLGQDGEANLAPNWIESNLETVNNLNGYNKQLVFEK